MTAHDQAVLEIRTYMLHPGQREAFARVFREGALPMLQRHGIDVVAHGPSLHHADGYFLMRCYPSLGEREAVLERFYGSEEWRNNYDDAVMAMIANYTTLVIAATPERVAALRES